MKWFQHRTCSHDDPDISDAWDELGDFGYLGFFVILEVYGEEFSHIDSEGFIDISKTFLRRKLRKSWTKVELLLNFYSKRNRIESKINGKRILINIPNFIDVASNWTKRPPTEAPTEVPTAIEVEENRKRREEEEKKKKIIKKKEPLVCVYTPEKFLEFYEAYPKHAEKKDALLEWKLLNKRNYEIPSPEELIKIVNLQVANNVLDTRESCKYCMSPRRWLHGDRWLDEIPVFKQEESPMEKQLRKINETNFGEDGLDPSMEVKEG